MRTVILLTAALIVAGPLSTQAQPLRSLPPGAETREAQLLTHMGPQARAFVRREAQAERSAPSEARARSAAEANRGLLGITNGGDIDALVMLVMMEVNREAEADLRDQMADMQKTTQQKAAARQQHEKVAGDQAAASSDLAREYTALKAAGKIAPSVSFAQFAASRPTTLQPVSPLAKAGIQDNSRGRLDSVSDLSQEQQARLQSLTDQRSKLIEMLSNLMKKQSSTSDTIVGNLK